MSDQKKISILLIDDDRFLLDMYVMKFSKSGIAIETASDGAEALNRLRDGKTYNILIVDIIMPKMDGLEFLKTVQAEKLCPDAAVVMLTNQGDEMEKAKALGADGYIIKASTIPSEVVNEVLGIYEKKSKK